MGSVVEFRRRVNCRLSRPINTDTSPAFFALADQRYIFVNPLGAGLTGSASGWLACDDWFALIAVADRYEVICRWRLAIETRNPISVHYSLIASPQKRVLSQALPQYNNLGEYLGHSGWLIDASGVQMDDMKEAYFMLLLNEKLRRERLHRRVKSAARFGAMVANYKRHGAI